MGKEEWRDAFLLDIARGSAIVQLWGDLGLLDHYDVAYLADVLRWMRSTEASYRDTIIVGGDPWAAEAYGYAQRSDQGVLLTLHNPTFAPAMVHIDPAASGIRADEPHSVVELYPFPGAVASRSLSSVEGTLAIPLLPFELRCLDVRQGNMPAGTPSLQQRPPERASRRLELPLVATAPSIGSSASRRALHLSGSVILPDIQRGDHIALVVRLQRAGQWWYHPEPQSLVQIDAHINGLDVFCEVAPRSRSYNGPGCPWVAYDLPVGPASTGQILAIEIRGQLPVVVDLRVEVHLYDAWWLRHAKRFAAPG
jgi:hypothetical protein